MEIEKRRAKFKEAMIPWIEDFDGKWGSQKKELIEIYDHLKSLDLDKATNIDLLHHLMTPEQIASQPMVSHFEDKGY